MCNRGIKQLSGPASSSYCTGGNWLKSMDVITLAEFIIVKLDQGFEPSNMFVLTALLQHLQPHTTVIPVETRWMLNTKRVLGFQAGAL